MTLRHGTFHRQNLTALMPMLPTDLLDALPELRTWAGRPAPSDLQSLPAVPAVYLLLDAAGAPVQLATTQSLRRLLLARLCGPLGPRPGRADVAEVVRGVRWRPLSTPFEGRWWYYRLARELHPQTYRRLIAFGPAQFLHVDWEQPVPQVHLTERIWREPGQYIGPWATQKAGQEALHGLRDLFDLCRYPEQVARAPHGTRCAYAEMGRCDAPCDGSVPLGAFIERCRAAWRFAAGAVPPWIDAATVVMRQAAVDQRYEYAGQLKRQVEFARQWQRQWGPHLRPSDELNYLLALRVTRRRAWKLLLFSAGHIIDGPVAVDRRLATTARPWLAEELGKTSAELPAAVRMEQTWLVAHWLLGPQRDEGFAIPLPERAPPANLEAMLVEQTQAFWPRRAATAKTSNRDAAADGDRA